MGLKADLSGLNNFIRRLKQVEQLEIVRPTISSKVADKGVELANTAYSDSDISRVSVTKETSATGDYDVVASGEGLAFTEYGTGYYAQGTYEGELPQSGVPITGKWDYYYDNPETKITIGGTKGWMLGSNFMIGENAGNQMYDTAVKLGGKDGEARPIVKQIVKELLE